MTDAERYEAAAYKATLPKAVRPRSRTATEEALERSSTAEPGSRVRLTVEIANSGEGITDLRLASDDERPAVIAERADSLRPSQDTVEDFAASLGGTVLSRMWLVNQLELDVPASAIPALAALPTVIAVHWENNATPVSSGSSYTGTQIRNGTLTAGMLSAGKTGAHGGRIDSTNVRVGVIESWYGPILTDNPTNPNFIYKDHVGFKNGSGVTRIAQRYACDTVSTGCVLDTGVPTTRTHGTFVTGLLAGSIEAGQDSLFNFSPANVERSGQSPQAGVWYYRVNSFGGLKRALEQAVADGIDVINVSAGWIDTTGCDPSSDAEGLNAAVRAAYDQGVLLVFGAGNEGFAGNSFGGCNMRYPAWRPEILAVNGLNTSSTATNYTTSVLESAASSKGAPPMYPYGGGSSALTRAGIAMSAPGVTTLLYRHDATRYDGGDLPGSSYASPIVAGAAVLLKHALYDLGWNRDGRFLFVEMLLQTDSWDHNSNSFLTSGASNTSGAGRLRMHYPGATAAPSAWGQRSFWLNPGDVVTYPVGSGSAMPSGVQQWKWAVYWNEPNLSAVSDVDVEVWDTCTNTRIAYQWDYDLRNRVQLRSAQLVGKCLQMRVKAYTLDSPRLIYSADFYQGAVD